MFWIIIVGFMVAAAWMMRGDGKVIGIRGRSFPVYDQNRAFLTKEQETKRQSKNFSEALTGISVWVCIPLLLAIVLGW